MTPIGAVAAGLLLVLLDLRLSGFDVLPDVLGWLVAVRGLGRLVRLDPSFWLTRACAGVASVLSLTDLVHPQRTTTDGVGSTTTAVVPPEGLQAVLSGVGGLVAALTTVLLCLVLRDRARRHGDIPLAERFSLFAFLQGAVGVLLLAAWVLGSAAGTDGTLTPQGPAAAATFVLVLAVIAMEVWFLLTLAGARTRPWLQDVTPPVAEDVPQG